MSKAVGDVPAGARKIEKGGTPRDLGPTNGLIGWWPLEDLYVSSTNKTLDISGNANIGTIAGATLTTNQLGQANKAYNFSDTKYISLSSFTFPPEFYTAAAKSTFSFWLKMSDMTAGYQSNFITKDGHGKTEFVIMKHWWSNKVYVYLGAADQSALITAFSAPLLINNWYHITVVIDYTLSSQRVKIYLNGLPSGNSASAAAVIMTQNDALLTIANNNRNAYNYGLRGDMSDVRIYNRALSDTEVSQLWSATKP